MVSNQSVMFNQVLYVMCLNTLGPDIKGALTEPLVP